MRGRRYRDENGLVHETRHLGMTILLCEEKDGHRINGFMVSSKEDPSVEVVTCLECLVA